MPVVELGVGLVGPGLIGATLLKQIHAQAAVLLSSYNLQLHVFGITNSSRMLLDAKPLELASWQEDFSARTVPADLSKFAFHLQSCPSPFKVIVDCTATDVVPKHYMSWMHAGIHVVTPNKKFGAGPLQQYRKLKQLQSQTGQHFFYEGTVGAGLPIISTLKTLIGTGDKIQSVEGILSGTLSFIFNTYQVGSRFSDVVASARAAGYTEPDPREDLSGQDVARKVVILARECGLDLELAQLQVESLVPAALRSLQSADEFMALLPQYDEQMGKQLEEAAATGEVIRYVGTVDVANKTASVALKRYPKAHPFAQLVGSDNMVVYTTNRYNTNPLIIRGPGAGAEVTAAGVFGDLLQLGHCCGARS